ncbi:MAG: group III truncated hemoglobin [Flavobacteriaceae bacterium]|nr:group III truncated hemoglobin [Flavobacteriaceae bacterium]
MKDIENREDIKLLVDTFYDKVQKNNKLDYFFNTVAQLDWESHLPKMYDFWETILFHKAVYKGNPMKKHIALHQLATLKKENFDTWLVLFGATVDELFKGKLAEQIKIRATSIATAIQLNTVYQKN